LRPLDGHDLVSFASTVDFDPGRLVASEAPIDRGRFRSVPSDGRTITILPAGTPSLPSGVRSGGPVGLNLSERSNGPRPIQDTVPRASSTAAMAGLVNDRPSTGRTFPREQPTAAPARSRPATRAARGRLWRASSSQYAGIGLPVVALDEQAHGTLRRGHAQRF